MWSKMSASFDNIEDKTIVKKVVKLLIELLNCLVILSRFFSCYTKVMEKYIIVTPKYRVRNGDD